MRQRAFTIVELLTVIAVMVILLAIFVPTIGKVRQLARQRQSSIQMQDVTRAFLFFGDSNNSWLPGMNSSGVGVAAKISPLERFKEIVRFDYIEAAKLYSPAESNTSKKQLTLDNDNAAAATALALTNISYAVLKITVTGGTTGADYDRNVEWRTHQNNLAVLVSDRGDANMDGTAGDSIIDKNVWQGHVAWGGGMVTWQPRQKLLNLQTKYNETLTPPSQASWGNPAMVDDLFVGDGAFMVHTSATLP